MTAPDLAAICERHDLAILHTVADLLSSKYAIHTSTDGRVWEARGFDFDGYLVVRTKPSRFAAVVAVADVITGVTS